MVKRQHLRGVTAAALPLPSITVFGFPAISCGVYGYPAPEAAHIAVTATLSMLEEYPSVEMIYLVCLGDLILNAYRTAFADGSVPKTIP